MQELRFDESSLKAIVDEDTEETWVEEDRLYGTIQGRVRGRGILFDPRDNQLALDTLDLADLKITTDTGATAYTDAIGSFVLDNVSGPITLTVSLLGQWAYSYSPLIVADPPLSFSVPASPGETINVMFNPSGVDEWDTAQVNGYYHTTSIHDWIKARVSTLTQIDTTTPLYVFVNDDDLACNAFYDPDADPFGRLSRPSINFFQIGSVMRESGEILTCRNTAFDTVIYHEYGHFVDDKTGGISSRGLSEGWGDVFASFVTGQPLVGEGFFINDPNTPVRTADNAYLYPLDGIDEDHTLGQAWSGFAWHLRDELIRRFGQINGVAISEQLIIPAIAANSPDIPSAAAQVAMLDDDDATFANGTPHLRDIAVAAARHRLPLRTLGYAHITTPAIGSTFHPRDGTLDIRGVATGPGFRRYELFYGVGTAPAGWSSLGGPVTQAVTTEGLLSQWSFGSLLPGWYTLKLSVTLADAEGEFVVEDYGQVALEAVSRVTIEAAYPSGASMTDNWIVWLDQRGGLKHLYLCEYDAVTETCPERRLTADGAQPYRPPDVSGNRIVWEDTRPSTYGTYLCEYDPQTDACPEQRLSSKGGPAIDGDLVSMLDGSAIWVHDLAQGRETRAASIAAGYTYAIPDISASAHLIVWAEYVCDGFCLPVRLSVCEYDPPTGACQRVKEIRQLPPPVSILPVLSRYSIDGNTIVWDELQPDGTYAILRCNYDAVDGTCPIEEVVSELPWPAVPDQCGNVLAWMQPRGNNSDVHYCEYNPATGSCPPRQVTFHPAIQTAPRIGPSAIVFADSRIHLGSAGDIYLYEAPFTTTCGTVSTIPLNHAPVLGALDAYQRIEEGQTLTFGVTATDQDEGDTLTFSASNLPLGATFNPSTKIFAWTPTAEQAGYYSRIRFAVSDGQYSDWQEISVTVEERSLGVGGTVRQANGQPFAGVTVTLQGWRYLNDRQRAEVVTQADGSFRLADLTETFKLSRAITRCQQVGICRPVTVKVKPKQLGYRFRDAATGERPYVKITFDPANLLDVRDVDFVALP